MNESFPRCRVEEALDGHIERSEPLSGGCISPVFRVRLDDGREVVVKFGDPGGGLDLEAWMLGTLGDAGWPVPAVYHAEAGLLVLEFIDSDDDDGELQAAEVLAELHSRPQSAFGLQRDTVIAGLPQCNAPGSQWIPFFAEHRLLAMAEQARSAGQLEPQVHRAVDWLAGRLERWLLEPQHPSLIHGDLWSGNVLFRDGALAAVIDPACYCADAEIELAFGTLFGTFSRRFFDRYAELRPLAPGFFEERRDLYNLYPLLVHLRLFGAAYAPAIISTLRQFGALRRVGLG